MDLLNKINSPLDLKLLNSTQLKLLSDELRSYIIETVSEIGGHFASNLGSVETAIALHYVFDSPEDKIIWDTGHQCYPHKILTGRKDRFRSIRKKGGISGFPKISESIYDHFGVGHSSTSLSAALGMAVAEKLKNPGSDKKFIAVIGDGAMTAGLAFEALNNARSPNSVVRPNLLILLNDNKMSISKNVGALNNYFTRLASSELYATIKSEAKSILRFAPPILRRLVSDTEEEIKSIVSSPLCNFFEIFECEYLGIIDGHDVIKLVEIFKNVKKINGVHVLHLITEKGRGYTPAENDPIKYHSISKFEPNKPKKDPKTISSYSEVFGKWLVHRALKNKNLIAVTPAMCEGSGMVEFAQKFPDRYFDVGIAEQHSLTFAAGMALEGFISIVAIYSTFLQRAYDQLIHDVALQKIPVILAIDRAGIVGADGATHNGAFDISFLSCIPNVVIMTPSDELELYAALNHSITLGRTVAIRYPRGGTGLDLTESDLVNSDLRFECGKSNLIYESRNRGKPRIDVLLFGSLKGIALESARLMERFGDCKVHDMRFVKPLDLELLEDVRRYSDLVITLEEGSKIGGAGSLVLSHLAGGRDESPKVILFGLGDSFVEQGDRMDLLLDHGISSENVVMLAERSIKSVKKKG